VDLAPSTSSSLPLSPHLDPSPAAPDSASRRLPAMKFMLDDMEFIFPYDKMYPEQYNYVCDLKRSLDAHVGPPRFVSHCRSTRCRSVHDRDGGLTQR